MTPDCAWCKDTGWTDRLDSIEQRPCQFCAVTLSTAQFKAYLVGVAWMHQRHQVNARIPVFPEGEKWRAQRAVFKEGFVNGYRDGHRTGYRIGLGTGFIFGACAVVAAAGIFRLLMAGPQ